MRLEVSENELWKEYYEPVMNLVGREHASRMLRENEPSLLPEADASVRVAPPVLKSLLAEQWADAGRWCAAHAPELTEHKAHGDGIEVIAGESWSRAQIESSSS